jgi:hypothetical protein
MLDVAEQWGEKKCFGRKLLAASLAMLMEEETWVCFHTGLAEETDICLRTVFLTVDSSQECFLIQKKNVPQLRNVRLKFNHIETKLQIKFFFFFKNWLTATASKTSHCESTR